MDTTTDAVPARAVRTAGVAVVGGGLAGAVLAWRLGQLGVRSTVFTAHPGTPKDATEASGGLVRAFEIDPEAAALAALSLAELRADPLLRAWSHYQEATSSYLVAAGADRAAAVRVLELVEPLLPGSAQLVDATELPAFRNLPPGTGAVLERAAGRISPAGLRRSLLHQVAARGGTVRPEPVTAVLPGPAVRSGAGAVERFDAVVLATGPWTPTLLARWQLPDQQLRSKQIQYTLGAARLPGLGVFVDETSGLYGRPDGDGFLLGLPTERWDVDPAGDTPDQQLADRLADCVKDRFGLPSWPGPQARTVVAADCYARSGGLALRELPGHPALFTFTGGTGGAAKTAVQAGRLAARELHQALK
ncbi:hypothetical protein GCM10009665_65300 [Kitasatospora nipponensis]|uniref:FAD dependent oxidoreductase domain-containing protein n=1 Tax=Kitasatospora nipponensis TaxID=258049 RepID=A0ABN1WVU9_9ACTN